MASSWTHNTSRPYAVPVDGSAPQVTLPHARGNVYLPVLPADERLVALA